MGNLSLVVNKEINIILWSYDFHVYLALSPLFKLQKQYFR